MAYTYDDFLKAANGTGLLGQFSRYDLETAQKYPEFGMSLLSLKQDVKNATTPEQKVLANEAANQLRSTYGYTGGSKGSEYIPVSTAGNSTGVSGSGGKPGGNSAAIPVGGSVAGSNTVQSSAVQVPTAQMPANPYYEQAGKTQQEIAGYAPFEDPNGEKAQQVQQQIDSYGPFVYDQQGAYDALVQAIVNREPFSYDPSTDPQMAAYQKQYLREGDRATANALAQASAMTGGRPSSWAVTAATQAGDYHAAQLADKIPALYQNALQQYLNEANLDLSALAALEGDRAFDYGVYGDDYNKLLTLMGNYQNMSQEDYERWLNGLNLKQNDLNNLLALGGAAHNQWLDGVNLGMTQQQVQQDQEQQKIANALALYQVLGYATPEIAAVLGIPEGMAQTPQTGGTSTGGGGGWDNGGVAESTITQMQNLLGVTADGKWGDTSRAAALVQFGTDDPATLYKMLWGQGETDPLTEVKQLYPDGKVTDDALWDMLKHTYGTEALTAAGLRLVRQFNPNQKIGGYVWTEN